MYELDVKIPIAKDLKITIKDRDVLGRDDVIGETVIDLEQRLLSQYRATCGLPNEYYRYYVWASCGECLFCENFRIGGGSWDYLHSRVLICLLLFVIVAFSRIPLQTFKDFMKRNKNLNSNLTSSLGVYFTGIYHFRSGIYQWRDVQKPKQILADWCAFHNKPSPVYGVDNLNVDNKLYSIEDIRGNVLRGMWLNSRLIRRILFKRRFLLYPFYSTHLYTLIEFRYQLPKIG